KKTTSYKELDGDKVRCYLDVLTCFPNTPIVYIDETGIDTYLYRQKARAVRGQKVYDKVSGRRFERISVVAGQAESKIVAPLLYHGTMTADLFTKWYQEQLLPSLTEPHLIVMDNATFHPKKRLDDLSIANGHYFLPLPPYSPELNPIEQFWASLKRKVTELLRRVGNVQSCLEYYFKTK
ncbi:transposase, partial [Streptococcus ruminantium]|nr:transposase [Streptococcus ruminantium]